MERFSAYDLSGKKDNFIRKARKEGFKVFRINKKYESQDDFEYNLTTRGIKPISLGEIRDTWLIIYNQDFPYYSGEINKARLNLEKLAKKFEI